MMRTIVAAALRFRFLVVALAIGLMVVGIGQIQKMPVDVFPEFAPPKVEIQTLAIGLSPPEVENQITVPMEEVLAGTPGLDIIRSRSVNDLSQIELIFERDVDIVLARQLVQERMDLVAPNLPTWAAPPVMLQPLSATSRTMKIGISSDKLNNMQQSMIAYWTIRQRLLRVPGVANVPIWGERIEMLTVKADRERMAANGVDLDTVMETTANALEAGLLQFSDGSFIGTGGFVDTSSERINVRHRLSIASVEDLANVTLGGREGLPPLRLGDVATVEKDHPPMIGDAVINGGPGLMLIVEKLPWANTLDVTRGVEEAIEAMQPGLPDLEIDTSIFRPATFIETSLDNLSNSLLIGCLLMILMLFLFLYEWRVALISVIAIPLSLVAAALVLAWRGTTINTMILAGFAIALGDVVDDAIIDIENVVRRLRQHREEGTKGSIASVILSASLEVRGAIVFATLIEVVAVVPVFFLEGLSGAFFRPLVFSYAIALLVSMAVALTVTPALALIVLRKAPLERKESPIARWMQQGYAWVLSRIVTRPRYAFASVGLVAIVGISVVPGLGQSLLPDFKERDFLMHWLTKPGTSLGRGGPDHRGRRGGDPGHPGRPELRRPHRAGLPVRRAGRARVRGELGQRRPVRRLRRDPGRHPGRRRWLPRADPRRPDLPEGAGPRGARRVEPPDRHPHLRPRPRGAAGQGPGAQRRARGDPRDRRPQDRAADADPPGPGRGRPRQGPAVRAQAG